jgi:peptide/nickel transport system permease protein
LAGYRGGILDNFLSTVTNIFLVIPSFVILILITVSLQSRGFLAIGFVIGITAWPWTARSVRAQTTSLRNRDHVNLSKLSGHSMPRIIFRDILPYLASYVMMAFILQVASGILAEASLSMLGLGPQNVASLGLMMHWAMTFSALPSGAWWAFLPVVLMIALITFSLNLINSGLDQIFNPQIRS